MTRYLLGAHVPAVAAVWIWRRVQGEIRESAARFDVNNDPATARALRFAADELEASASAWSAGRDLPPGFVNETRKPEVGPSGAGSGNLLGWLTPAEAAVIAGCTPQYVGRLAKARTIKAVQRGRFWEIDEQSVRDFAAEREARRAG